MRYFNLCIIANNFRNFQYYKKKHVKNDGYFQNFSINFGQNFNLSLEINEKRMPSVSK